ncbi:MAG: NfeD family protein [Pseudomonadota bacterium]
MTEFLVNLSPWHWFALALLLLIVELIAPASFFLWLGLAAGATGLLLALLPLSWQAQWVAFSVFSVLSIIGWLQYRKRRPQTSDQPKLNRRGERYVGRTFTLSKPIVNGVGKVRVDDSSWKVNGPDRPAGSKVRVTKVDGVVLVVEPLEEAPTLEE